jgi:hypothetical protein
MVILETTAEFFEAARASPARHASNALPVQPFVVDFSAFAYVAQHDRRATFIEDGSTDRKSRSRVVQPR